MAVEVKVEIKGFPIISAMKSPNVVRKKIKKAYRIAGFVVGRAIVKMMRKTITGGVAPTNKGMTRSMKGSSKPLVDSGRLLKAITHKVGGPYHNEVAIGVMRSNASANVAAIVATGAQINVTKRMATLFKVLHAASTGKPARVTSARGQELLAQSKGVIPALREGTTLNIPPRPFHKITAKDPKLKGLIRMTYTKALQDAIGELKGGA